jgi:hypothetical protein
MALRTNRDKVKEVIATSLTDVQVEAFISDANLWVTEELAVLGLLSADRLELIERYLACALIRLRDLGLKTAKFDDIAEQYQVDPEVTDYMLRAVAFDSTGTLRKFFLAPKEARVIAWRTATPFVDEVVDE